MSAAERTAAELAEIRVRLARLSGVDAAAVMMALIEQLIEESCGTHPQLRDVRRLRFYRGVLAKVGG